MSCLFSKERTKRTDHVALPERLIAFGMLPHCSMSFVGQEEFKVSDNCAEHGD